MKCASLFGFVVTSVLQIDASLAMDPLSLATAVITIGGLVKTTTSFLTMLAEVRRFDKEIKEIEDKFRLFGPLLELCLMTIGDLCQQYPESAVVQFSKDSGLATGLVETARGIRRQIRVTRSQLMKAAYSNIFGQMLWTYKHKPQLSKLYPEMESLKVSLLLVQSNINLSTTEDVAKKARLKKAIKELATALTVIQDEQLLGHQSMISGRTSANHSVASLVFDTSALLLELSRTMREKGRVPEMAPAPAPREIRARRPRPPDPEPYVSDTAKLMDLSPPAPQFRRTKPASTDVRQKSSRRLRPSAAVTQTPPQRLDAFVVPVRKTDGEDAEGTSEVPAGPARAYRALSLPADQTAPESPTTPSTPPVVVPARGSTSDLQERKHYHDLVLLQSRTVQGFISPAGLAQTPLGAQQVTARCYGHGLDENFITLAKAQELGLTINQIDPEADPADKMVLVAVEGNTLVDWRAIGTVEVRWRTLQPPGFRLMMWVLEGGLPEGVSIALGEPFEKSRRSYNRVLSLDAAD